MKELQKYIELLENFYNSSINAEEFKQKYFELFKNEKHFFPEDIFLSLDKLFCDLDVFYTEQDLKDISEFDVNQIKNEVSDVLQYLKSVYENSN